MKYDWSECLGKKYNLLTVIELAGKDKFNHPLLKCRCDCGNECIKVATQVKNGIRKNCGKKCRLNSEDVSGQKFGKLTAIQYSHHEDGVGAMWDFKCDCGNIVTFSLSKVTSGYINSCGCLRKENARKAIFKDLTGQKFNHLTVIRYIGRKNGRTMWHCLCDCGNEVDVDSSSLKSGNTTACGCRQSEGWGSNKTHGMSGKRIYRIWMGIKNRCYYEKNKYYSNYGGRGIRVCDEWLESFENFYKWAIENGYAKNLTIDRIDNDGNYEPSNCRWVTRIEQMNNTRRNRMIEYNGERKSVTEFAREFEISPELVHGRLNRGWSVKDALTIPKGAVQNYDSKSSG